MKMLTIGVINMENDRGPSIARFYQEYGPTHHIKINGARAPYEIYFTDTMQYCVPVL